MLEKGVDPITHIIRPMDYTLVSYLVPKATVSVYQDPEAVNAEIQVDSSVNQKKKAEELRAEGPSRPKQTRRVWRRVEIIEADKKIRL